MLGFGGVTAKTQHTDCPNFYLRHPTCEVTPLKKCKQKHSWRLAGVFVLLNKPFSCRDGAPFVAQGMFLMPAGAYG
jgi:hypothetical protein